MVAYSSILLTLICWNIPALFTWYNSGKWKITLCWQERYHVNRAGILIALDDICQLLVQMSFVSWLLVHVIDGA